MLKSAQEMRDSVRDNVEIMLVDKGISKISLPIGTKKDQILMVF